MTEPEQITKVPSAAPIREKDPKKVAAGKALAVRNKAMREEHARYKAEEAERNKQMKQENERYKAAEEDERLSVEDSGPSGGFLSQLSLANVLSLVGIGLTVYTLFFKGQDKPRVVWKEPVETTMERQEETSKVANKKNRQKSKMDGEGGIKAINSCSYCKKIFTFDIWTHHKVCKKMPEGKRNKITPLYQELTTPCVDKDWKDFIERKFEPHTFRARWENIMCPFCFGYCRDIHHTFSCPFVPQERKQVNRKIAFHKA